MAESIRMDAVARIIFALVVLTAGICLFLGGIRLISLGGSPYYALCGAAMATSGILVWRRSRLALLVYLTMLLVTTTWAVWESGFEGWALLPRLLFLFVLGLGFLLPGVRAAAPGNAPGSLRRRGLVFCASLVIAVAVGAGLNALREDEMDDPLYQAGLSKRFPDMMPKTEAASGTAARGEWHHYGNDPGGSRFSPLDQIKPDNVEQLEVAWKVHVGRTPGVAEAALQATPIKIGESLYLCTGLNDVLSLDAETGDVNWRVNTDIEVGDFAIQACRGVAYFEVPGREGTCARRIITNTVDARLIALDAMTGTRCAGFGRDGEVDLMEGMGDYLPGFYFVTSAPTIVRGKIVLGGGVADGVRFGEPSGVIRAYDAVTGTFAWAFDLGRLERQSSPPEGETFTHSTPNAWAPMSADPELGLVFAPTGNTTPDYYGGVRRDFDDRFSSAVVAIDADTGKLRWVFQTTHHDIWDYDVGSQPGLVDIATLQGTRKAVVQATKRGELFVLDRQTGEPIFPVEERPVPTGPLVPGERIAPTQPFSIGLPSFGGATWQERDMWGVTPFDQLWCRIAFKKYHFEGKMTPPGPTPTLAQPGFMGGMDWGSVAIDRNHDVVIVNSNRMGTVITLMKRKVARELGIGTSPDKLEIGLRMPQEGTPYAAIAAGFLSPLGVPCNEPPYGLVSAVDLRSGKLLWTRWLGTARDSGPLGIPSMLPIPMGLPNTGGSLVTQGGLVFIAAAQEHTFRALDARTGKTLWRARLPAGGQASPMSYWSEKSRRQFVVIAAGGNRPLQAKIGDAIVAYALPGPE